MSSSSNNKHVVALQSLNLVFLFKASLNRVASKKRMNIVDFWHHRNMRWKTSVILLLFMCRFHRIETAAARDRIISSSRFSSSSLPSLPSSPSSPSTSSLSLDQEVSSSINKENKRIGGVISPSEAVSPEYMLFFFVSLLYVFDD